MCEICGWEDGLFGHGHHVDYAKAQMLRAADFESRSRFRKIATHYYDLLNGREKEVPDE